MLQHLQKLMYTFQEFDFRALGDGRSASARYANNSNYRNDSLIRKESTSLQPWSLLLLRLLTCQNPKVCVSSLMLSEIKRIIKDSEIIKSVLPLPSNPMISNQ